MENIKELIKILKVAFGDFDMYENIVFCSMERSYKNDFSNATLKNVFYLNDYNDKEFEKYISSNYQDKELYWHMSTRDSLECKKNFLIEIYSDTFHSSLINKDNILLEILKEINEDDYYGFLYSNDINFLNRNINLKIINEIFENKSVITDKVLKVIDKYYFKLNQKGKKKSLKNTIGFWIDIDIHDLISHKDNQNKFTNRKDVLNFLNDKVPFSPTLIINSGSGYHVYYLFKNKICIENEDDLIDFESLNYTFTHYLRNEAKEIGCEGSFDYCHDGARMFKVPFSYNLKDKNNKKYVSVDYKGKKIEYNEITDFIKLKDNDSYLNKKNEYYKSKNKEILNKYFANLNTKNDIKLKIGERVVDFRDIEKRNTTPKFENIYSNCLFTKYFIDNPSEAHYHIRQELYRMIKLYEDGDKYLQKICSFESEKRISQYKLVEQRENYKGALCSSISQKSELCKECPLFNKINSPCSLAYKKGRGDNIIDEDI